MLTTRRGLLQGLGAALAAAVLVKPQAGVDLVLVAAEKWAPRRLMVATIWGDVYFTISRDGYGPAQEEVLLHDYWIQANTPPLHTVSQVEFDENDESTWESDRVVPVKPIQIAITEEYARQLLADTSPG